MTRVTAFKVKAPKIPKVRAIHITPASTGGFTVHHFGPGLNPSKSFTFPTAPKMMKHLVNTVKQVWEGGKSGMPRPRGSMAAHRQKQLETTSY